MVLDLTRRDEFSVITLNRPEALNALNAKMIEAIAAAIDEAAKAGTRALLFVGAGPKAFCAGADIKELLGRSVIESKRFAELGQRIFAKLDTLAIASVAIIDGYAFGGGLELALACSFRLATPKAKMGLPEVKLGLVPGYGGTQRLPRLVGESRALEIVMTGRTVEAEEALAIGLVNRMVGQDDPLADAMAYARAFTPFGLPVLRLGRAAVFAARDSNLADGLRAEADLGALAQGTQNAREGVSAFLEKRKAAYRDD